jgi:hypothetical protein
MLQEKRIVSAIVRDRIFAMLTEVAGHSPSMQPD